MNKKLLYRAPGAMSIILVYNKVSKKPVLAIEVDGYAYHHSSHLKGSAAQHKRDIVKNGIFESIGLPLLRLSTTGSDEKTQILNALRGV